MVKVGEFVVVELHRLFNNGHLSEKEIRNLHDKAYCKQKLNINYPLLIQASRKTEAKIKPRYWQRHLFGEEYAACSQWYEDEKPQGNRAYFEAWLKTVV